MPRTSAAWEASGSGSLSVPSRRAHRRPGRFPWTWGKDTPTRFGRPRARRWMTGSCTCSMRATSSPLCSATGTCTAPAVRENALVPPAGKARTPRTSRISRTVPNVPSFVFHSCQLPDSRAPATGELQAQERCSARRTPASCPRGDKRMVYRRDGDDRDCANAQGHRTRFAHRCLSRRW
jgi:hypothetical protein